MQEKQLNRIMRLVRNTGDRLVILDRESDETMVMMNLDEYENLLQNGCEEDCDCNCDCGNECDCSHDSSDEDEADEEFFDQMIARENKKTVSEIPPSVEENFVPPMEDFEPVDLPEEELPIIPPNVPPVINKKPVRSGSMESIGAILNEEPLGDVPHEEEEEPFLLEPVE